MSSAKKIDLLLKDQNITSCTSISHFMGQVKQLRFSLKISIKEKC